MRNELMTPFWKNALESLPASLRPRYVQDLAAAERWELRIDAIVKGWTRAKAALTRTFQAA
jgi:hypothetical protein